MSDDPTLRALFALHTDLPRQGPGSDACTLDALNRLPPLRDGAVVLDVGCGTGRATRVLAQSLAPRGARIVAVDVHRPFLAALRAPAGAAAAVVPLCADMGALPVRPGCVDLLWSEGAAYLLGLAEALARWRPVLRPEGLVALTELSWLGAPSAEAGAFWARAYPGMGTVAANRARAEAAGFRVLGTEVLPPAAWWDEYYGPLAARCAALRAEPATADDAAMTAVLAETEAEMALYRQHAAEYGYVWYLLQRTD